MTATEFNKVVDKFNNEFTSPIITGVRKDILYLKTIALDYHSFENALNFCLLYKYDKTTLQDIFTELKI